MLIRLCLVDEVLCKLQLVHRIKFVGVSNRIVFVALKTSCLVCRLSLTKLQSRARRRSIKSFVISNRFATLLKANKPFLAQTLLYNSMGISAILIWLKAKFNIHHSEDSKKKDKNITVSKPFGTQIPKRCTLMYLKEEVCTIICLNAKHLVTQLVMGIFLLELAPYIIEENISGN